MVTPNKVWSIAHPSTANLQCPKSFGQCMKGHFWDEWHASLFKHLDSNAGYNTVDEFLPMWSPQWGHAVPQCGAHSGVPSRKFIPPPWPTTGIMSSTLGVYPQCDPRWRIPNVVHTGNAKDIPNVEVFG
jgi:hypothetical protein